MTGGEHRLDDEMPWHIKEEKWDSTSTDGYRCSFAINITWGGRSMHSTTSIRDLPQTSFFLPRIFPLTLMVPSDLLHPCSRLIAYQSTLQLFSSLEASRERVSDRVEVFHATGVCWMEQLTGCIFVESRMQVPVTGSAWSPGDSQSRSDATRGSVFGEDVLVPGWV